MLVMFSLRARAAFFSALFKYIRLLLTPFSSLMMHTLLRSLVVSVMMFSLANSVSYAGDHAKAKVMKHISPPAPDGTLITKATVQDCLDAIPICQNVYHEDNAYTGEEIITQKSTVHRALHRTRIMMSGMFLPCRHRET